MTIGWEPVKRRVKWSEDFEVDFDASGAPSAAPTPDSARRCWVCDEDNPIAAESCAYCDRPLILPDGLHPGAWLGSRYEIISPLGAGAMGWVFKADDHVLGTTVALKVLRPEVADNPRLAQRFRSEVCFARRVRHRNVCGIHDYGEDRGHHYLSMEYVEGKDLKQTLRRAGRPLSWSDSYDIVIQAAHGLQAIHDAGVIHRDVKTANMTRDHRGIVRLMDFGIAREWCPDASAGLTAGWHIVGTPEYMSPEQVRGSVLDSRSDVYSLGVVIYEVFTGRVPFCGDTPVLTLLQQIEMEPAWDGDISERLPRALIPVLRQALSKQRLERFESASALAVALEQARDLTGPEPAAPVQVWPTASDDAPTLMVPRLAKRVGVDPQSCLATLLSALKSADPAARLTAARALGDLGGAARAAVPDLVRALRDESGPLRVQAAHALRRIGPSYAAGAVFQLLQVMQDDRTFVSEAAAEAWARLTARPDPPGQIPEDTVNRYRR